MRKLLYINLIAICIANNSCESHKSVLAAHTYAFDAIMNNPVTIFNDIPLSNLYHPNSETLVLRHSIRNWDSNVDSHGLYSLNPVFQYDTYIIGEWNLYNDTLCLRPMFYAKQDSNLRIVAKPLKAGIDTVMRRYLVVKNNLFDITDLTYFNENLAKDLGYSSSYIYNPDLQNPKFILAPTLINNK